MRHRRPNLPTLIAIRLVFSPLVIVLFYLSVRESGYGAPIDAMLGQLNPVMLAWTFGLLVLQEISDAVDGEIARRSKAVTDLGKLLDPLADTMSHIGVLLGLMWVGLVPLWLLVVVYYREAVVATLRTLAAKNGVVVAARISGKAKALSQAVLASGLVGAILLTYYVPSFPLETVAEVLSWIVGVITVISLVDYAQAIRKLTRKAQISGLE